MLKIKKVLVVSFFAVFFISVSIAAQNSKSSSEGTLELDAYRLQSRIDVAEITDDLSGLTFNPLTQSLFAVTNAPELLLEMTLEGDVKRVIPLLGFEDTEGITHIEGNRFAIVEERKRQVVFIEINGRTTEIKREHCEGYALALQGESNKGLEGIAWSKNLGILIAKEDEPEQLYHFDQQLQVGNNLSSFLNHSKQRGRLGDVAGLHSLANGNTLFLSEESRLLLELSVTGEVLSSKSFEYDPFGIFYYIRQPEGVTMADDGRLYIVSEPNQLFIFEKPKG